MQKNELLHVMWHDAQIEKIVVLLEGQLEIHLKYICTYHQFEPGKVEMWSSQAIVLLTGVTHFSVDNIISDEYIDGDLLDLENNQVELLPVGSEKQVAQFKIYAAGAGANIDIVAKTACITSLEHLNYIQDYPWPEEWEDQKE